MTNNSFEGHYTYNIFPNFFVNENCSYKVEYTSQRLELQTLLASTIHPKLGWLGIHSLQEGWGCARRKYSNA